MVSIRNFTHYAGYAVPSDYPLGIGSDEFIWFWYNGEDCDESKCKIISVSPVSKSSDKIVAKVKYTDGWDTSTNDIVLVKLPGTDKWLIDDFDGMKNNIYEYINDIGIKFMNEYANEI